MKRKGKSDAWIKIASLIFCILLTVMFASAMSGGFFLNIASDIGTVKMPAREYFSLVYGSYDTYAEAEKAASTLKSRGGAGYIHKDNAYKVHAALYLTRADAESVSKRLSAAGSSFSVHRIEVPAYKFEFDADRITDVRVTETLELCHVTVEKLYALFVDLEGNAINDMDAQARLAGMKAEAARGLELIEKCGDVSRPMTRLKAELVALTINIAVVTEPQISESTRTLVKYTMLKTAYASQAFAKEM